MTGKIYPCMLSHEVLLLWPFFHMICQETVADPNIKASLCKLLNLAFRCFGSTFHSSSAQTEAAEVNSRAGVEGS